MTHVAYHVADVRACIRFYEHFCAMKVIHERGDDTKTVHVVWMAEEGREHEFIMVLVNGGDQWTQAENDYRHLGFAVGAREEVDRLASLAKERGCLFWPPREEPYPVGYYCGIVDPNGNVVEFSYGQPLGPGAPPLRLF